MKTANIHRYIMVHVIENNNGQRSKIATYNDSEMRCAALATKTCWYGALQYNICSHDSRWHLAVCRRV